MSINLFWHICLRQQPGQSSSHEGGSLTRAWAKGLPGLRFQISVCTHHVSSWRCSLVRSEQCWVSLMASMARLKAALNKPAPDWCQRPPVCDTGAFPLVCLPLMAWAQLGAFHSGDICRTSLVCWTTYFCEPDLSSLWSLLESGPISRNSGRAHKQYSATSLGSKIRNSF